jgi:hypothetical protein
MTKTDHIAALLLDSVLTTIKVKYQTGATDRTYTFKCLKTLAQTLSVGDRVLVDSAYNKPDHSIAVVIVTEIHPEMDIDLETDLEYKYCFAKVDESELSRLKAREVTIVEKINRGRQESIKQKMLQELDLPMSLIESIASDITPEDKAKDKAGTVEICEPDFSNPALQALMREKGL